VLSWIWVVLVVGSVMVAAFTGHMEAVSKESLEAAKRAIQLVIDLTGGMILFLGLMRVASEGGLLRVIVRGLQPLMRRLFPELPDGHPAKEAMIMNFAANMMGLGNAATPFGIKAMVELDRENPHPGVATNTMALFLAINTSSIVLFPPTGTVMVRLAAGSQMPFAIWVPTLIATFCSTTVALLSCLLLARLPIFRPRARSDGAEARRVHAALPETRLPGLDAARAPLGVGRSLLVGAFLLALAGGFGLELARHLAEGSAVAFLRREVAAYWLLPVLIAALVLVGVAGRVRVYDVMVEAGKEGLDVAVRIAPFLVAILVAIAMFRASGALDLILGAIGPALSHLGVPVEAIPMALLRPLSGSGAFGVMAETLQAHGPDSFAGLVTSTLMGSTETTFYVLAVYLGAVGIRDARHILPACLAGDLAGFVGAVAACHLFFPDVV